MMCLLKITNLIASDPYEIFLYSAETEQWGDCYFSEVFLKYICWLLHVFMSNFFFYNISLKNIFGHFENAKNTEHLMWKSFNPPPPFFF